MRLWFSEKSIISREYSRRVRGSENADLIEANYLESCRNRLQGVVVPSSKGPNARGTCRRKSLVVNLEWHKDLAMNAQAQAGELLYHGDVGFESRMVATATERLANATFELIAEIERKVRRCWLTTRLKAGDQIATGSLVMVRIPALVPAINSLARPFHRL
jgi:hypothetical protein